MRVKDLLQFASMGLRRRKARTFLTILGVIIGTVCIVLMISIGLSNYKQFEQNLLLDQSLSEITVSNYADNSMKGGITDSKVHAISSLPHVKSVSPVIELPVTIYAGNYIANIQLKGIDAKAVDVEYAQGGIFDAKDTIPRIVFGGNTMQYFIDPDNPLNYSDYAAMEDYSPDIDIQNTELKMILGDEIEDSDLPVSQQYRAAIAGVTEKSYSESSYDAYVDIAVAKRILMENREIASSLGIRIDSYTTIKIIVDDMDNVGVVLEEVKKLGYETYSSTESILQMQDEQARQQGQLFAIGFISLLVSAIGIANTMYANILERRRDIGVMKVLGMRISWIRSLFMVEAALIGALGGLLGVGISYIMVLVINTGTSETSFLGMYFSEGMLISIPLWLAGGTILIAVGIGVLSGIYPAYKATKMSSLEAMRK